VVAVSAGIERDGDTARERVEAHGRRFWGLATDLADREATTKLLERLSELPRPIDILVNNAGTIARAPAVEHSDEAWDHVLEVNVSAAFRLARALGAGMVSRGRGKIVFVASLLSFQGGITVPGYAASKHAIAGVTKALANEWAAQGVNVNAIAPGYIATDNTEALRKDPVRSRAILERIPAGRWGRPDDLAGAAVFLASPASDYVNGTVLVVDGGWLAR
jgi:2-deoxy-D-gluconate 3-dehydrogenase